MQRTHARRLPWILLLLLAVFPFCRMAASSFNWSFRFRHPAVFASILAVVAVVHTIEFKRAKPLLSGLEQMLCCLMPIFSIAFGLHFTIINGALQIVQYIPIIAICVCCFKISRYGKPRRFFYILMRIVSIPLAGIMMILILMSILMMDFGATNTLNSIDSPSGRYTASVIDIDQGALGGNTAVRVQKNRVGFVPIKHLFLLERTLFMGEWGIGEDIEIEWFGDNTLFVNGIEHKII